MSIYYQQGVPIDDAMEQQISHEAGVEYSEVKHELDTVKREIEDELLKRRKATSNNQGIMEHRKIKCKCGNDDQTKFITNSLDGDVICKECGTVVAVNALYEGDWNRNFEGEEDNSQCGAAADPNMSDAFNLKTLLVSSTGKNSHLQHKQSTIEMNLSKIGRDDKETRQEFKDKMKVIAHANMERIVRNLDLNDAVLDLAHRYFCIYRDSKPKVSNMPMREAQCLILALRERRSHGINPKRIREKGFTIECPRCHLLFSSKLELRNHVCDKAEKKEKVVKKKIFSSKLFKKPVLKDELEMLNILDGRKH